MLSRRPRSLDFGSDSQGCLPCVADATVTDPGLSVCSNRYQTTDPTNLVFGINRYRILSQDVGFYKGQTNGSDNA
jgi:hypothetical protein